MFQTAMRSASRARAARRTSTPMRGRACSGRCCTPRRRTTARRCSG
jgi:hypothetical protein